MSASSHSSTNPNNMPNPKRLKQRRKVLTEEDYTSTLSSIVARDYFPDIASLERQNALLDRRSRGDIAGAVAVRRAARRLMEHEEAKAALREQDDFDLVEAEGNGGKKGGHAGIRKRPRPLEEETLTGFHERVTNEDDQEFDANLKQEINANRQRLENLFQGPKAGRIDDPSSLNPLMLEMASDDFAPESNRIAASDWNRPNIRNSLFFNPTPLLRTQNIEDPRKVDETRQHLLTGQTNTSSLSPESHLMLPPSKQQTKNLLISRSSATTSEAASETALVVPRNQLVEYIPKHVMEKKIQPSQSRFPSKQIIPVPNRNGGIIPDFGSDADDYQSSTDGSYSTDLDAPLRPVEQERWHRNKKMQAAHESYVAMTPLIIPGVGAGNQSPITTWGTVDGTPVVLSGQEIRKEQDARSSACSSSFSLAAETARERAARQAESDLARRAKRASASSSSSTRRERKLNNGHARASASPLTPAALSLLEKTRRIPSRSRDAFASALRTSYASQVRPGSSRMASRSQGRSRRDHAFNATPLSRRDQQMMATER